MGHHSKTLPSYIAKLIVVILCLFWSVGGIWATSTFAQRGNQPFYLKEMFKYRKRKIAVGKYKPRRQCRALIKKKHDKKNKEGKQLLAKKTKHIPMAERGPSSSVARVQPQSSPILPAPNNLTASKEAEQLPEEQPTPEEKAPFEKKQLPAPVNEKQERIRKQVEKEIMESGEESAKKLPPLYFTFDEDEFAFVDMEPFLIAAEYALHGRMLLIEGHTDSRGNDEYNKKLSIKRVEKIRKLMMDMGVPDGRISVVGYGEENPDHDNNTEEGRQLNRRVDFTVF